MLHGAEHAGTEFALKAQYRRECQKAFVRLDCGDRYAKTQLQLSWTENGSCYATPLAVMHHGLTAMPEASQVAMPGCLNEETMMREDACRQPSRLEA